MTEWIKWWKDKTFLTILVIVLIAMASSFLVAYFTSAWWISIIIACGAGLIIRKIITNKLDKMCESTNQQ